MREGPTYSGSVAHRSEDTKRGVFAVRELEREIEQREGPYTVDGVYYAREADARFWRRQKAERIAREQARLAASAADAAGRRQSTVYLLHFDRPYKHARHYVGFARDLEARLIAHQCGLGARLVSVIVNAGLSFALARTWRGTRRLERQLKRHGGAVRFCPLCFPERAKTCGRCVLSHPHRGHRARHPTDAYQKARLLDRTCVWCDRAIRPGEKVVEIGLRLIHEGKCRAEFDAFTADPAGQC